MSSDDYELDESDVPSADTQSIPDSVADDTNATEAREALREAVQYYEAGRPGYAGKFIRRALEALEGEE